MHVYDCWSGIVVSMQQMHVWLCVHGMFLIIHLMIPCLICLFYTLLFISLFSNTSRLLKKHISVWYVVCSSIEQNKSMFGMWSVDLLNSSDNTVFGMYTCGMLLSFWMGHLNEVPSHLENTYRSKKIRNNTLTGFVPEATDFIL